MKRKPLAIVYVLLGLILSILFFSSVSFPVGIEPYFKKSYYGQFGGIAICVELIVAGIYLYLNHSKTNFAMALFAFTALFDPIFNFLGIFSSSVPLYGTIIFIAFAIISFWIAFTNAFDTGKISNFNLIASLVLGLIVEYFFNPFG